MAARIYISGRPPVTNLYSSAVFIGWAVVAFCLIWEWLYRNGLATFLGSLLAFSSLVVAHSLAADGDTFTVLQAVSLAGGYVRVAAPALAQADQEAAQAAAELRNAAARLLHLAVRRARLG